MPVSPCASGSPPRRLLSLLRLPLWLSDSAPLCLSRSLSAWYPGVPRLEHPYLFLRLGHTWPLISRLQLPGLWPPSFPLLEQALEFPFPALNSSGGLPQNSTNGERIRASRGEFLQRLKRGDWTLGLRKSISSLCFGQVPPAKLNLLRRGCLLKPLRIVPLPCGTLLSKSWKQAYPSAGGQDRGSLP